MSTRSFPMMVLPVSKALELEEFPKHEDVKQHLVEWQPSMGNVAFFSHTWLSWTHPDGAHHPKWNLLRQLLNLAVEGKLEVWAHMNAASQQMFDKTAKKQRLHIPKAELQAALTGGFIWLAVARAVFKTSHVDVMLDAIDAAPLHSAVATCNLRAVKLFVEARANVDTQAHHRRMTPLMVAASLGHAEIASTLIAAGASTRALDRKRRTAAQHAARGGHAELADRLGGAPVRV